MTSKTSAASGTGKAQSDLARWIYLGCGFACLGAALVGLVMPIVPAVPFLIVAAACFARSSKRFHEMVLRLKHVGPVVREWEKHRRLPAKVKVVGIVSIVLGLGTSIAFFVEPTWLRVTLALAGLVAAVVIFRIPSAPPARA